MSRFKLLEEDPPPKGVNFGREEEGEACDDPATDDDDDREALEEVRGDAASVSCCQRLDDGGLRFVSSS